MNRACYWYMLSIGLLIRIWSVSLTTSVERLPDGNNPSSFMQLDTTRPTSTGILLLCYGINADIEKGSRLQTAMPGAY